jgi:outer membrane protein assembly factor BamB
MNKQKHLYIFSNGRIAKITKSNGEIVWEVKLKAYGLSYVTLGSISVDDKYIYFGGYGQLLCLSEKDGSLVWKNELKGWGYSYISFANQNDQVEAIAANTAAIVAGSS